MNLHEFQAKQLFTAYGVPAPKGLCAETGEEATTAARQLGGERWVIKAQVHSGGRGKAGGVLVADRIEEVSPLADRLIGQRLITPQTGAAGLPIHLVLIETPQSIQKELYLCLIVDRSSARVTVMASTEGGMDIEAVAEEHPEKIQTLAIHPATGYLPHHGRELAYGLGLAGEQVGQFGEILAALYQLFIEKDLSQIEINPLIIKDDGKLMALDAKINVDDNALALHPELSKLRDPRQEDEAESAAREYDLSYVTLDGEIGCMVNGAGLAMATLDVIKLHGGNPANFLDVGGSTTSSKVAAAFKLILSDTKVKVVLVNIFGGIVRCNLIAEGIVAAIQDIGVKIPVVVRLEGTNAVEGRRLLDESGLQLITADNLDDAARKAVEAAQ